MLIVQVCDFGSDGDARYRLHDPSRYLSKLDGVTAIDCHFFSRHLYELTNLADVLVLQFVNDWDLLEVCQRRRAAGRVTVFEANDYFFDMQPWSPIAGAWQDRVIQELYLQLLVAADAVQTSTDELARQWRRRGAKEIGVFANQLTDVPPLAPAPDRSLTIGWAGSPGHLADWYAVAPALQRWLNVNRDVRLAVMTNEVARPFFQLPPERYSFSPFGSLEDYLRFLGQIDIGLAPLLPTEYNRGRSDVKFLEYASRGVAGIYADLEPYRASVIPGKTGLLHRNADELISQLDFLRTNVDLRHSIRREGHAYVVKNRKLDLHIGRRLDWYRSLLHKAPGAALPGSDFITPTPVLRYPEDPDETSKNPGLRSTSEPAYSSNALVTKPLPTQIQSDTLQDGNYLQIRADEAEKKLLSIPTIAKPAESATALAEIVSRHPDYLPALQYQGRVLNDLRDHAGAMRRLDRAAALAPGNPHTQMEIARTLFLQNQVSQACALLETVVGEHPRYLPAWQYLLRLASWNKTPANVELARRADAMFPTCYPIALMGVQSLPPELAVDAMLPVLERHGPTLSWAERPAAIAAFGKAIVGVMKAVRSPATPFSPQAFALIELAVSLFPESPHLAGDLGGILFECGDIERACEYQDRALSRWRQGVIARGETTSPQSPPLTWQLARHVLAAAGNED
ncbi:MAG TPA: tetratricopeptide repeat protein [Humisphaera sp.]|nr:tetratricopeptide repeat protein [Humisphaera sp.]